MQVILFTPRVPVPCGTAKDRQPVIGGRAVRLWIGPDVPIRLGIIAALAAFCKPRVLVRAMREHQIDHHPQTQIMRLGHQCIKVREIAEHRIDVAIVAHVITVILHWRREERRNPDRVHPERGNMLEPRGDARQIANAIAIAVLIAAWIDLIDHRPTPPVRVMGQHRSGIDRGLSVHVLRSVIRG